MSCICDCHMMIGEPKQGHCKDCEEKLILRISKGENMDLSKYKMDQDEKWDKIMEIAYWMAEELGCDIDDGNVQQIVLNAIVAINNLDYADRDPDYRIKALGEGV